MENAVGMAAAGHHIRASLIGTRVMPSAKPTLPENNSTASHFAPLPTRYPSIFSLAPYLFHEFN
jgi:hypothetical protein